MDLPDSSRALARFAALVAAVVMASPVFAAEDGTDSTTVTGKVFIDATHVDRESNGRRSAVSGTGLDLTRFYLDLDHRFNRVWSAHVTTDINWLRDMDSPTDLWVKRAYVSAAFSKALVVQAGAADLPWTPFVNNWAGYRYVDRELVTRLKYGGSSDWGVHLHGAAGARGEIQYALSAVTGAGYKKPTVGERADFEARLAWQPSAHTVLTVGAYDGTRAQEDEPTRPAYHTARRWNAMAAYADNTYRAGAQYFQATDWNRVTAVQGDRASGWSAWASAKVARDWAVFARYDHARTSEWLDPSRKDRYSNFGVEWNASKALQVALAYKRERVDAANIATTTTNEVGIWAQASF